MTCLSCLAGVADTTVFCPYCGEQIQQDSESQPTRLLAQERDTTLLNTDTGGTSVLSGEQAREVVKRLTAQKMARSNE